MNQSEASQIDKLNILDEMERKVPVLIISDGKTYIQLENNLDLGISLRKSC